jgi:hypothetical protein
MTTMTVGGIRHYLSEPPRKSPMLTQIAGASLCGYVSRTAQGAGDGSPRFLSATSGALRASHQHERTPARVATYALREPLPVLTLALTRHVGCAVGIYRRLWPLQMTPVRTTNGATARSSRARQRRRGSSAKRGAIAPARRSRTLEPTTRGLEERPSPRTSASAGSLTSAGSPTKPLLHHQSTPFRVTIDVTGGPT